MKLDVLQENFSYALTLTSRVLVSKPQIPILANILLVAKDEKLTLTASNVETSLVVTIGAKIETEGEFTVPGRTLSEIIASLSAEKINLELKEGSLLITSGAFRGRLNGQDGAEYPRFSPGTILKEENFWEIGRQDFLSALEKVLFAVASDESRAALTGVLFKPDEKGLTLVATDGFRLSTVGLAAANSSQKIPPIIIPAGSLTELVHLLSSSKAEVKDKTSKIFVSESEKQAFFDLGDIKIFSRLVAGNFPDYEKIIPSDSMIKITTTVEELLKTVRLAAVFARESANIVRLKIEKGKFKISANAPQVGENESEIDVEVSGKDKDEELAIAFNFRYLLDFLGVVSGEVTMEFSSPLAPGVFRASSSPNFLHIIMPVRVKD